MTYRVVFDFGNIEVTVYQFASVTDHNKIQEAAEHSLKEDGFTVPSSTEAIITIEPCPEWDKE